MADAKPPILLLSSGRCGSTLLQRIVNTSAQACIWGEHNGFLRPIATAFNRLTDHHLVQSQYYEKPSCSDLPMSALKDFTSPIKWANSFDRELVERSFRELILSLLTEEVDVQNVHWGFKEIRYREDEPFMPMWNALFPETRFVFLIRHPLAVIQSMLLDWNKPTKETLNRETCLPYLKWAAGLWRDMNSAIVNWNAEDAIISHLVRFEDIESDAKACTRKLFDFLQLKCPRNATAPCKKKTSVSRGTELAPIARELIMECQPEIQAILGQTALDLGYDSPTY